MFPCGGFERGPRFSISIIYVALIFHPYPFLMSEHQKDFDNWNERKKKIHQGKKDIYFNEREIWWCMVGVNVGFE